MFLIWLLRGKSACYPSSPVSQPPTFSSSYAYFLLLLLLLILLRFFSACYSLLSGITTFSHTLYLLFFPLTILNSCSIAPPPPDSPPLPLLFLSACYSLLSGIATFLHTLYLLFFLLITLHACSTAPNPFSLSSPACSLASSYLLFPPL